MGNRYMVRVAVMLFLLRDRGGKPEILLQRRQNTGYADGLWDCGTSGHVEKGEPMTGAMIREAKEELGIRIAPADLRFATLTYKTSPDGTTYCNAFFTADAFEGVPAIMEEDKCAALKWFPLDALPEDLLEDRREALCHFLQGVPYSESGWA